MIVTIVKENSQNCDPAINGSKKYRKKSAELSLNLQLSLF